jgi:SAM-dependent methyltransferase
MTAFADYANYYDSLYHDKDYAAEASFVEQRIQRHLPDARSLLDLGCGTARHAIEFAQRGYAVEGVEISPQMVELARARAQKMALADQARLQIVEADASQYRSERRHDIVAALFHVICYQTSNRALAGLFRSARHALRDDGLFIFDFWYGPAVLSDRPTVRVKQISKDGITISRRADPMLDAARNLVEVTYRLDVVDSATGHTEEAQEVHTLRYLFIPEIELFADHAGFQLIEVGQWLSGAPLGIDSWLGYGIARASRA